jgi:hypothetical protein
MAAIPASLAAVVGIHHPAVFAQDLAVAVVAGESLAGRALGILAAVVAIFLGPGISLLVYAARHG